MNRTAGPASALAELFDRSRVEWLDNGLTVCLLENPQAPLVTTSLWYRAGTRHDPAELGGMAHLLEHMMFKGSRRYGPGAIDRLTQVRGGSNNAFTGHDATAYYFTFSRDHWHEALDIEADRMVALSLDGEELERERRVVLEEISMYEDDPWDALERDAYRAVYRQHPYGRPVLGDRESVARIGREELARFHRRFYCPANAVLVLAGDVDDGSLSRIEKCFSGVRGGQPADLEMPILAPAGGGRAGNGGRRSEPRRVERRHGETARLLVALPAPAGDDPDLAALWLALWVLAGGRASRLHRALVDDGRLCSSVTADATEMVGPGLTLLAAEPLSGVEEEAVEAVVVAELSALAEPVAEKELERARRLLLADWVFALERIDQQALVLGGSLALFDAAHTVRFLRRVESATAADVARVARRNLALDERGVIAWSRPSE